MLGQKISDLSVRRDIDELRGLVGHELFDLMISDVDVLHATMENWIFGALEGSQVVLVEHGRHFVVIEFLWHLRRFEVLRDEKAVDARCSDVSEFA